MTHHKSPYRKYTEYFSDGSSKDITNEIPFEIPENWAWCRLGEITMINPKNNIEDNKDVSFIPMTLISDGFSNKHSYEVRLWGEVKKGFTHFQEGDIGIAKITPCFENRKSVIFSNLINGVGAGTTELHILRPFAYSEIKKYIYWFINTESFIQRGISHFSGAVGQQRVGKDILENTLLPLPPLSEQRRIVEKIEELLALVDDLETNKTDLQNYIKQAKSKVLEMAVRGELVPQNPEDEPASVLLERIKKEQKSSKSKGKTTAHNTHYEEESSMINKKVPNGWEICFLRDISSNISSKPYQILQSEVKIRSDIPVVSQSSNYIEGYSDQKNKLFVVDNFVIIFGDHTRNIKYIDFDFIVGADGVKIIKPYKYVTKYIYYLLVNVSEKIENRGYSRHFQFLEKYPLNFPPFEEQHRIVEKIEGIFSALEFIEETLI